MAARQYFVYILSNAFGTLYVGMTNDLSRRVAEHRSESTPGFTSRYRVHRLIYFETTNDVYQAIAREKQLKAWTRKQKLDLIRTSNPRFKDLAEDLN